MVEEAKLEPDDFRQSCFHSNVCLLLWRMDLCCCAPPVLLLLFAFLKLDIAILLPLSLASTLGHTLRPPSATAICRFPPLSLPRPPNRRSTPFVVCTSFTHCPGVRHQRVRSPWRAIARCRRWGEPPRRPSRTVTTAANDANQTTAIPPPIRAIPVLPVLPALPVLRPLHHR